MVKGIIFLIFILLIFISFSIAMLIIYKSKLKDERESLIRDILISTPNPSKFNKLKNLGYEDNYGWIWNERVLKELSYNDLVEIYNVVYF